MPTREDEIQEVRRLLGSPKPNAPSLDGIVSGIIRQEQSMTNRLNLSGKGWTDRTATVTSVADQAEYDVETSGGAFGKPLFVYRDLGDAVYLPVPFTDFSHELNNQKYEFWRAPLGTDPVTTFATGEKVAFYRTGATQKMRVYPAPAEAGRIYTIRYAVGALDWSAFDISDSVVMPEWSFLRCLWVAAGELIRTEWLGLSFEQNSSRRREFAESLGLQIKMEEPRFEAYIRNPVNEPITDSGYWWE